MALKSMVAALCVTAAFVFTGGDARAQSQSLVTEEMMVKSPDPGIEIYVRNKRPAHLTAFAPERTLLFVRGVGAIGYPGSAEVVNMQPPAKLIIAFQSSGIAAEGSSSRLKRCQRDSRYNVVASQSSFGSVRSD